MVSDFLYTRFHIMLAIVSGATGYIGRNLVDCLVSSGWTVLCVVRNVANARCFSWAQDVNFIEYDGSLNSLITLPFSTCSEAFVFNIAANTQLSCVGNELDDLINDNITLGVHLLEMMRHYSIKYMINTGTFWQLPLESSKPNNIYTRYSSRDIYITMYLGVPRPLFNTPGEFYT